MVFARILLRKELRERGAEARHQPVVVVLHRSFGFLPLLNEVGNHLDDYILRQAMQVELDRMLRPVTAPVIVQVDLDGFVELIDAIGEQLLDALILGERDVRADVEDKARSRGGTTSCGRHSTNSCRT